MKKRKPLLIAAAFVAMLGAGVPVAAQMSSEVEAALESGAVGEQADGYIGFTRPPPAALKAQVDAINIKRREGYTHVAQAKNVPIEAFAASVGCHTLTLLKPGRAYQIGGAWAVKGANPISLPAQCGS